MPKEDKSPDRHQVSDRENSVCSVETTDSSPGKEGKSREKGRSKGGDLKKLFSLPESEVLVDDFICALRRRVLYQGRMYIFEHYLCFYSRLFNHQKIVTIPLKEVTQIRKKKHYGFSNSLSVVWKGKRDTFTSFLKRDNAYKILSYAWSKSSPYAKLFGGVGEEDAIVVPKVPHSDSKKILGSVRLGKLVHRPNGEGNSAKQIVYEDSSDEEDSMYHTGEPGGKGSEVASHHDSDSDAESDLTDTAEGTEEWQPVSAPPPPPDPQATILIETDFDISVHDFYKEFLSDKSQFFPTWHEARGDTKVHLSEWHKHPAVGFTRELTFITPLKQKIGPSKCLCTQTQRVRLHPGDHLIFETSQIMDIPYGDHFSVETRWDFTPTSSGKKCKAESRLSIPFSKKTMFKGTIESSTKSLCKEASGDWVKAAKRWLEPPIPISPAAPASCFADSDAPEQSSPDSPPQRPTHFSRADSLKLRMSSDLLIPDADVLSKAPTAYRSDIARVLQLRKLDSSKQSRLGGRLSGSKTKSTRFEDNQPGVVSRIFGTVWEHPVITLTVLLVVLVQVAYLYWRGQGASPSFLSHFSRSSGSQSTAQESVDRSSAKQSTGGSDLSQVVATMQVAIEKLQQQVKKLEHRLDTQSC